MKKLLLLAMIVLGTSLVQAQTFDFECEDKDGSTPALAIETQEEWIASAPDTVGDERYIKNSTTGNIIKVSKRCSRDNGILLHIEGSDFPIYVSTSGEWVLVASLVGDGCTGVIGNFIVRGQGTLGIQGLIEFFIANNITNYRIN